MQINFRPDREAHLIKLCKEMGRSVDEVAGEAILSFMQDYEDGRDAQEALLEGGRTYTQEEMERELELKDRVHEPQQKTA